MSRDTVVKVVDDKHLQVSAICTVTNEPYEVVIDYSAWKEWHSGKRIQDAFPSLAPEQREFLLSGITPEEWKKLFGSEP